MRDFRTAIASASLALAAWTTTVNPSQADTGTVHILYAYDEDRLIDAGARARRAL